MKKATRGLILEFVKKLNQNSELGKLEDSLFENICDILEKTNDEEVKTLVISLEKKIMAYTELVKYQYFDYGVTASDIEGEVDVKWEPKGLNSLMENYS